MLTAKCTVSFFFIEYYTNIHMAITGNYEKKNTNRNMNKDRYMTI